MFRHAFQRNYKKKSVAKHRHRRPRGSGTVTGPIPSDDNFQMTSTGNAGPKPSRMRATRGPAPLDPHPSLVLLFVSSSPSSSQRLGPAPSLSDLTATVCMHARVFTVQAPPPLSCRHLHVSGSHCQGRCLLHLGPACAHFYTVLRLFQCQP